MGEYSKYIAPERRSVPTPKDMVKDGKCVFGTFDKEFETMDLMGIKNPTHAPDCLKKFKLTLWEATEVHMDQGVLLAVVCDMGIFGLTLNVYYDKAEKKVYSWSTNLASKDTVIAPNLINGSEAKATTKNSHVHYVNNFQDGKCDLHGRADDGVNSIKYKFTLTRISKPCVVSIPFAPIEERHRPLYSQKDFFKAEGTLTFNGKTYETSDVSTAVVDDHRGYYPRKAHYDWVTTMGVNETDGEKRYLAFNLTRNQSVDQDKYNENLIWLENETSLLPPVTFTRDVDTREFKDGAVWKIKDEHGMVDITFKVYDIFRMVTHAKPIVNIDYFVAFGELEGYVLDENGKKYVLDGMMGMGEDKTLLL
ncbi:MAG: DUF2804 family protein [Christensenellales bacterium]